MTTQQNGEHQVTAPDHNPIKVGTLADILKDVGEHFGLDRVNRQQRPHPE